MEQQIRTPDQDPRISPDVPPTPQSDGSAAATELNPQQYLPSAELSSEFNEVDARAVAVQALREKASSSVGVMYGVMAFSVVNAALISFSAPFSMAFGLSAVDFISSLTKESGNYVHLLWNLIPLGFYLLLTTLAKKHWGWLIFLMVCYTLDGVLSFIGHLWIGLAVHVYVLYLLWQGLSAAFAARKLERMPSDHA
ncbi:MAG: hypothetical protein H7145_02230 [Akkermansiaceae bacterium]|nr:hypothetical protein [Armatimonadota bacterium]